MECHDLSSSYLCHLPKPQQNEVIDKSENNDDEADLRYDEATSTLFRKPAKVIYTPSRSHEVIKANLIHFEDNGNFKEFDIYSNNKLAIYREKKNFDIVAYIKIEQAKCAIYRNDLNAARRLAREGHELAGHTQFPPLFYAEAFLVLSNISRNKHKLGNTKKYLDQAKQCFELVYSIESLACFHEQYGSYLDQFLGILPKSDEQAKELALTSFHKMSEIGSQDSKPRVSDKKRFYALLRSARILLDSNSSFGRTQRAVPESAIRLADKYLDTIKRNRLLDSIPRGSKIQYQIVVSDLCYREGKFDDAKELLKKSFDVANAVGYTTELPKIIQVVLS
jgi:hypothetical protein